jgi:hypothetical protein
MSWRRFFAASSGRALLTASPSIWTGWPLEETRIRTVPSRSEGNGPLVRSRFFSGVGAARLTCFSSVPFQKICTVSQVGQRVARRASP